MPSFRTLHTVRHHAMVLTEHEFQVPLDYAQPSGEQLTLFARAVRNAKKGATELPWLVFLQGGPGAAQDGDIDAKIAARLAARRAKNYAEADRIRKELEAAGIILEDGPGSTTWRRA